MSNAVIFNTINISTGANNIMSIKRKSIRKALAAILGFGTGLITAPLFAVVWPFVVASSFAKAEN